MKPDSDSEQIVVVDSERDTVYETSIRNVGGERDFNRVDIPGVPPDALEVAYSAFEGQAASALERIEASGTFEGDDRIFALNLAALLAVRHPLMRENFGGAESEVARKLLSLTLETKERWEASVAAMKERGEQVNESLTYEELKAAWEGGGYKIEVPRETHIRNETRVFEPVLLTMVNRRWMMLVADEAAGPFITCDRPVSLTWKHPERVPIMYRGSPGYGMPNTEVIFPISKRLALIGSFEDPDRIVPATREQVANVNSHVIMFARQIYAPKLGFLSLHPGTGEIISGENLLAMARESRARNRAAAAPDAPLSGQ